LADEAVYFFDVLFEVDFALLAELAWGLAGLFLFLFLLLGAALSWDCVFKLAPLLLLQAVSVFV
jgi:hypothetical protein